MSPEVIKEIINQKFALIVDDNDDHALSIDTWHNDKFVTLIDFTELAVKHKLRVNDATAMEWVHALNKYPKVIKFLQDIVKRSCCMACECIACDTHEFLDSIGVESGK